MTSVFHLILLVLLFVPLALGTERGMLLFNNKSSEKRQVAMQNIFTKIFYKTVINKVSAKDRLSTLKII